jgi:hypothetical protein
LRSDSEVCVLRVVSEPRGSCRNRCFPRKPIDQTPDSLITSEFWTPTCHVDFARRHMRRRQQRRYETAIGDGVSDQKRAPKRDPAALDGRGEAKPDITQNGTARDSLVHAKCLEPELPTPLTGRIAPLPDQRKLNQVGRTQTNQTLTSALFAVSVIRATGSGRHRQEYKIAEDHDAAHEVLAVVAGERRHFSPHQPNLRYPIQSTHSRTIYPPTLQSPANYEFLQYPIWAKLLQALELASSYPTVTSNFPTEYCTESTHSVRC